MQVWYTLPAIRLQVAGLEGFDYGIYITLYIIYMSKSTAEGADNKGVLHMVPLT